MLLPLPNLPAIILLCKNQVGLDPRHPAAGIEQKVADSPRIHMTVLVQCFPAFFCDGFDAALHGNTVGAAKQTEALFIPKIDTGLNADLYRTLGNALQQPKDVFANTKNLINEVHVINAAADESIDLPQDRIDAALAKLITKQRLIAKGAGPGAAAGELQFRSKTLIVREDVVSV